jgi:hypothetical protein
MKHTIQIVTNHSNPLRQLSIGWAGCEFKTLTEAQIIENAMAFAKVKNLNSKKSVAATIEQLKKFSDRGTGFLAAKGEKAFFINFIAQKA